jgi:hypothetical protein
MENFVRDNPLYDVEKELREVLRKEAAQIRKSTSTNNAAARNIAARSSPPDGGRQLSLAMLEDFKKASDEQVARLGGVQEETEKRILETLENLSLLHELIKDFNAFEVLYQVQQELAAQAQAYNRAGELSREDQLALKELAATEKELDEALGVLEEKFREDAEAAKEVFPKAARSGRDFADKMAEHRLQPLARQATGRMLAGSGEQSFDLAERLRGEMEKLFSDCRECQGGDGEPCKGLDKYLQLVRMNPGNTFGQMLRNRSFGIGRGSAFGIGADGSSGYAVMDGSKLAVMGNEFMPSRNSATGKQSSRQGKGAGTLAGAGASDVDKADVLKDLKPVNRQSGAVAAETILEEYDDIVESYFKTITTKKKP